MAGQIVTSVAKIIKQYGPNIIRSQYWEAYGAGGKKYWADRLQAAAGPHKTAGDPHAGGRALDIVLRANIPSEKKVADDLVAVFLALKGQLKFISVIYNGWEWNGSGTRFPRGGSIINRHVSHIHLEWSAAGMAQSGFENALIEKVKNLQPSETDYEFN